MKALHAALALAVIAVGIPAGAVAQQAAPTRAGDQTERAKSYFDAIDAVRFDSRRAFLTPKEVRYAFGVSGGAVDVLVLEANPDAPAIVARTLASSVRLSRIAFAGAGCWSARYFIEAAPDTLDAIEQARANPDRVVRAVPGGTDGLFPELDRACGGGYCSYNVPEEREAGGYLTDQGPGTTEDGTRFCIDPQVMAEHIDSQSGIPAVLSTSADVPCSERRVEGITDAVCQDNEELESYYLDWPALGENIARSAPLHCDHKQEMGDRPSVCDMLGVPTDEQLGRVTGLSVQSEGGLDRLTGRIEFRDAETARQVFELIQDRTYSGCGSVGLTELDFETFERDGKEMARVNRGKVEEFSLVQVGQDKRAGIAKLERIAAGRFDAVRMGARVQASIGAASADPYTLGALRRQPEEAPFCRNGVLTDPRKNEENR